MEENNKLDLLEVQSQLAKEGIWLVKCLKWEVTNGIVKAYPRMHLSDQAHKLTLKVFKRLGGRFAQRNGECWFEVASEPHVGHGVIARAYEALTERGIFE